MVNNGSVTIWLMNWDSLLVIMGISPLIKSYGNIVNNGSVAIIMLTSNHWKYHNHS
jgi:hypothetical protein